MQSNKSAVISSKKLKSYNEVRKEILKNDPRFSSKNGHLCLENVDLVALSNKYQTPVYVYSEEEINRNISEIILAFKKHKNTKIFYASKACSVLGILEVIKSTGISIEANSLYEIKKAIHVGFKGDEIVFNSVMKTEEDLTFAIENDLFSINVDSLYELDLINTISKKLKKTANICIRIEPNVPAIGHPGSLTAFHAKSGIDLEQAEQACRSSLAMPYVNLKGLHFHVGDQVPISEPFAISTKIIVAEAKRLEEKLGMRFEVINVGGGIPVPYKYDSEEKDPLKDYMYVEMTSEDFAEAIINEVHKWREDITICIEPGRKVTSSAAVLLSKIQCEKRKTNYDVHGKVECHVDWEFIDCGYSILSDSLHFDWFFYVFNASKIESEHNKTIKLAGPLCDGGDYFHIGVEGELFAFPEAAKVNDIITFLDVGAYSIESQTTYNCRPRAAVVLIDKKGDDRLIRKADTFASLIRDEEI